MLVSSARPPAAPSAWSLLDASAGLRPVVEAQLRGLVADELGIAAEELQAATSLADDLAVDSLDLLEIAIGLEAELGVSIAERQLESVRTFGDLVVLAAALVAERQRIEPAPFARAIVRLIAPGRAAVERAGVLTPYAVETIVEHAVASGPGTRVDVTVYGPGEADTLDGVRALFDRLGTRGIGVEVSAESDARHSHTRPAA